MTKNYYIIKIDERILSFLKKTNNDMCYGVSNPFHKVNCKIKFEIGMEVISKSSEKGKRRYLCKSCAEKVNMIVE